MNKFISLVVILIFIFIPINISYSLENKIILKVNNNIITSVDILNEIIYLESINAEFKNASSTEAFEISKKSLIKEKIKEIELLKYIEDLKIEEKLYEQIIKDYFGRLGIESILELEKFFMNKGLNPSLIEKKITIEILWNQLIYTKFHQNVKVDENLIKKDLLVKKKQNEYLLSEITIDIENKDKINEINDTISEKGFAQAALLHSDSDTAQKGGELGWVKETSINKMIKEKLINLNIEEITKPIRIPSGFIIIQVKDKREIELDVNIDNEIKLIIQKKTNEQLNQFSKIYFNKIKKNIQINEL